MSKLIIIDVGILEDGRVREKEVEKVEKYQDLAGENNGKNLGCEDKGCSRLGVMVSRPLRWKDNQTTVEMGIPVELTQRCAFLGSTRILMKLLEMKRSEENKPRVSFGIVRQLAVAQSQRRNHLRLWEFPIIIIPMIKDKHYGLGNSK